MLAQAEEEVTGNQFVGVSLNGTWHDGLVHVDPSSPLDVRLSARGPGSSRAAVPIQCFRGVPLTLSLSVFHSFSRLDRVHWHLFLVAGHETIIVWPLVKWQCGACGLALRGSRPSASVPTGPPCFLLQPFSPSLNYFDFGFYYILYLVYLLTAFFNNYYTCAPCIF